MKRAGPILLIAIAVLTVGLWTTRGEPPPSRHEHGEIFRVDGIEVLRVWGSPRERGRAHGYLMGPRIVGLLEDYLAEMIGDEERVAEFEHRARLMTKLIVVQPQFEEEMRGMLEGIGQTDAGRRIVALLNRPIQYSDLLAINCIPELARIGCSSFVVWGAQTGGPTICGRNLDWHSLDALRGRQIVIASIPEEGAKQKAWVSIGWPGFLGCLTGMNADGLTVAMHDVFTDSAGPPAGFTPRGFALREIIETIDTDHAVSDAARLLRRRFARVGNNVVMSWPSNAAAIPAGILEYDGDLLNEAGVTIRRAEALTGGPDGSSPGTHLTCTNHYIRRGPPQKCDRFEKLEGALSKAARAGRTLTIAGAWQLLRDVAMDADGNDNGRRIETYHSVVFEPDERRLHVAFSNTKDPAPFCRHVGFNIRNLLAAPDPVAAASP